MRINWYVSNSPLQSLTHIADLMTLKSKENVNINTIIVNNIHLKYWSAIKLFTVVNYIIIPNFFIIIND